MTPHAAQIIQKEDISIFEHIRDAIISLPDLDLGTDEAGQNIILSCHMLARAVGEVYSLRVVDGFFYPYYQHSWVETKYGNVIDPYPVGILGGPILVDGNRIYAPSKHLYLPKSTSKISQGRFSKPSFRRSVRKLVHALIKLQPRESMIMYRYNVSIQGGELDV